MLRVGLTGGLGSGKSAVALVFAECGAHILEADAIGRALMQPGEAVYSAIVASFGAGVVQPDGLLDRRALAREAFAGGRLQELNSIVHPAVLEAEQRQLEAIAVSDPDAIAVVESALIFESKYGAAVTSKISADEKPSAVEGQRPWTTSRFDRLVLVTAPQKVKVARYVARVAPPNASIAERDTLARDAIARLAAQMPDEEKAPFCDYVIENTSTLVLLRRRAQAVFAQLRQRE